MEALCLLMGGALAAAGAWSMLPGGGEVAGGTPGVRAFEARRRLERACAWLAELRAVRSLASLGPWKALGTRASALASERGISLSVDASVAAACLASLAAAVLGAALSRSPMGALTVLVASTAAVPAWSQARERAVASELAREMPDVFRSLAGALGAGQTLAQAVEYVALHERGPAAPAFTRASLRLRCGFSAAVALEELSRELDAPGVELLSSALLISQRTGSPLRELFVSAASLVERGMEAERSLRVKTAQVRLSIRIVVAMPLLMVALLTFISPDFQAGLTSPVGMGSVLVASALDAVALLIIRRLMDGVV
jgi:tight adherence protein B